MQVRMTWDRTECTFDGGFGRIDDTQTPHRDFSLFSTLTSPVSISPHYCAGSRCSIGKAEKQI